MLKYFFHGLGVTACLSLLSFANAQSALDPAKIGSIKEFRDAGTFELRADGTLAKVFSPAGSDPSIVWFESVAAVGSFFNIGDPFPDPSSFNLTEYVSHGDGLTVDGAAITGFTLFYATNMPFESGSLDVVFTYYDDGVADPAQPSPAAASYLVTGLPILDEDDPPGVYGFAVNVTIPPELQFALTSNEFQYGLRRVGGTGPFGPLLQPNIPGQTGGAADSTVNATVGTTYNFFESWTPPGQDGGTANDDGDGSGDNNWLFGPTGPWAGARHRVFAIGTASTVTNSFVYHNGYTGGGSPIDSDKIVYKETAEPTLLSYSNLINTSRGINGVGFDVQNLAAPSEITAADFEFRMSPTGAFDEAASPPTGWELAPAPTSVAVTEGDPADQILISWADNDIANRWLRITILANERTGLLEDEVFYIGHVRGETTGPASGAYTVSLSDITPIRAAAGSTVDSNSILDIDKNGTVSAGDIAAMRSNIGTQLTNITVPAAGGPPL